MPRKSKQASAVEVATPRDPDFFTVQEVAERLICSDRIIRRRIEAGKPRLAKYSAAAGWPPTNSGQ